MQLSKKFILAISVIIAAPGIYAFTVSRPKIQTVACINNLRQQDVTFNKRPVQVLDAAAPSNSIAADVDRLWHPSFKIDWEPIVERVVVCGDRAVPILTNRLAKGIEGESMYLLTCLCRIDSDASLKPVREILQDYSRDSELMARPVPDSAYTMWRCSEVTIAIREYPTNREIEILPHLIHYSDNSFAGFPFEACDRLRVMIHRNPTTVGVMIASLDDNREQFSYNLGDILNRQLGNPFRWPPGLVTDSPHNAGARYNSFWRDWWKQNKDSYNNVASTNAAPETNH